MTEAVKFFAGPCEFVLGAAQLEHIPATSLPEVAFIGRSNVGKSSLVNALTGRKALARTSNTPGRTQQLNFFKLNDRLMLVDLPGYGYARASKKDVAQWNELIRAYLRGRAQLTRVFVLIDARHGLKPNDIAMMAMLDEHAVSYQLVLTKQDKVKKSELDAVFAGIEARRKDHAALYPGVLCTSAVKRLGIEPVQQALYEVV